MSYNPRSLVAPHFLRSPDHGEVVSANERAVLRHIRMNPGVQRTALNELMDLSQQSVYRIVESLVERGMITLGDPLPGTGRGQPSPTLTLNPDYAAAFGISLNTDSCRLCLTSFAGETLETDFFPLEKRSMETVLGIISRQMKAMCEKQDIALDRLFGIGFGFPGYNVGGTRYNAPLPLHEWSLIELGPRLTEHFGLPAWVANGANAAAIGENLFGVGHHIANFAYLSFNYGFCGGIIVDGELFLGGNMNAGEYSGMFTEDEMSRRPALQFLIEDLAANGIVLSGIHKLSEQYRDDWPGVAEWVEKVAPQYNRLVNALWSTIDPQAIVFGGEMPKPLAHRLIGTTEFRMMRTARYGIERLFPKLIVSDLGGAAPVLGAASLPFKDMMF